MIDDKLSLSVLAGRSRSEIPSSRTCRREVDHVFPICAAHRQGAGTGENVSAFDAGVKTGPNASSTMEFSAQVHRGCAAGAGEVEHVAGCGIGAVDGDVRERMVRGYVEDVVVVQALEDEVADARARTSFRVLIPPDPESSTIVPPLAVVTLKVSRVSVPRYSNTSSRTPTPAPLRSSMKLSWPRVRKASDGEDSGPP